LDIPCMNAAILLLGRLRQYCPQTLLIISHNPASPNAQLVVQISVATRGARQRCGSYRKHEEENDAVLEYVQIERERETSALF